MRKLEWSPLGNFSGREIGSGERVKKIKFLFVVVERDTLLFYYKSISFQQIRKTKKKKKTPTTNKKKTILKLYIQKS